MPQNAASLFRATFGVPPVADASAPGRVHLICAQNDYNGGPVLPIAIAARTVVAVGPAQDGLLELVSTRDGALHRIEYRNGRATGSAAYVAGVLRELAAAGTGPA